MKLSINAGHFMVNAERARTLEECVLLVKNAGFNCIDLQPETIENPEEIAEFIKKNGMRVNQTHAPFNRYKRADISVLEEKLKSAVEKSKLLGADIMVVHGDEFDFSKEWTKDKAIEFNYRLFYPIVEFASANGMKIAFENVFEDIPERPRVCSRTEELLELVGRFDTDAVGVCWDFGHAKVQYPEGYVAELEKVADRVIATHVHDNYYGKDLHLFPFLGDTDWKGNMSVLKKAEYAGEFTFEFVYDRIPDMLIADYLEIIHKSGKYLTNIL